MNHRMIINIIGKIVCVEAVFMLPALIISLAHGEEDAVIGIAASMLIMLVVGAPTALARPQNKSMYAREGFITVGLAWIVVSALGALPFLISGAIPDYIDCLFETVSGFTTTGASILRNVEVMPMGLLYWRSFTHWLGGMGVLVFVLALSPLTAKDSGESMHLLRAESPGIKITKLVPRIRRSATILYTIYIVMTVIEITLLLLGRMPVFDSVTVSFGTAGTGGFAIKNDSIASYSPYCQWVITIFMLLFACNFNIFYLLLIGEFGKMFKNEELRAYIGIVLGSIAIITINIWGCFANFGDTLRAAAFQVASIISTTGFATTDFDHWPQLSRTILILLMVIGACAGSTGGGAKVVRVVVMFKTAKRNLCQALRPNSVKLIHMDGQALDEETVGGVSAYMLIYFIVVAIATLLVSTDNFSFETNFTAVLSCLNNIGPGLAAVGPSLNYGSFSHFAKIILTVTMLIGRLELYPILLLFTPSTWRK